MDCPRCHKGMAPVIVAGVEVDLCKACEGVWFDKDEMTQVMAGAGEALKSSAVAPSWEGGSQSLSESPGDKLLDCPRCQGKLERYRYQTTGPVLIDGCRAGCGVWLDDSELQGIYRYWVESMKPMTAQEKALYQSHFSRWEADRKQREELFVENLTRLDEEPGLMGAGGKVLQAIYAGFFKLGLR